MIIEAQVKHLDTVPDLYTAAVDPNDPRLKMELLRGMPIALNNGEEPVGIVIMPRIEDGFVVVTGDIKEGVDITGQYLIEPFNFLKEDMPLGSHCLKVSSTRPDSLIGPICVKQNL